MNGRELEKNESDIVAMEVTNQQAVPDDTVLAQPYTTPPLIERNSSLDLNDIFKADSKVSETTRQEKYEELQESRRGKIMRDRGAGASSGSKKRSVLEDFDDDFGKSIATLQSVRSQPKINPVFSLFVGLILSTTLATFSAFDAVLNCTQGTDVWSDGFFSRNNDNFDGDGNNERSLLTSRLVEEYYYNDQNENDQNIDDYGYDQDGDRLQQAQSCKKLFANVLTPISFLVITICIVCCKWALRDDSMMDNKSVPPCIEIGSRDRKRYDEFKAYVINQRHHLWSCYRLLILSISCFGLWTYAMFMLSADSDQPVPENYEERDLFQFQFQSLGAFNFLGEVGKNANLYYSSWISLIITIALSYELLRITYKQQVSTKSLESELELISRQMRSTTKEIEMVMTWSKAQQKFVKNRRSAWHESLNKLRFRAGFWLVVLIASVVIFCSSSRIWKNYIYPQAVMNDEIDDDGTICTILGGFMARDDMGLLHPSMCERTITSKATGIICVFLSLAALTAHYHFSRLIEKEMESSSILRHIKEDEAQLLQKRKKLVPLRLEFLFAFALTALLAYNAIFVTAVEGPGSKVGNLYYSSWISFVMSMLIMLGCLEDILDEEDDEEALEIESHAPDRRQLSRWLSVRPMKEHISTRLIMLPSSHDSSGSGDDMTVGSFIGGMPIPTPNRFHHLFEETFVQEEEASRPTRLRRWASGCVYSSIYLVSALDAAFHISYGELDYVQMYMVICPCIMVTFCFIMTCLCIMDYKMVNQFYVGGLVSMFLMMIWVGCLILTLHKESSWAVNEIAEIENANLYYFTWATVLNTGMLSSSYLKEHFHLKPKGLMVVLWLGVVKICFVMFGSCIDILMTVGSQCKAAETGDDTDVFCKRTEAGAVFGFLGMAAGFLAAVYRFFIPSPSVNGLIGESAMSSILAIIFAFSLAMVTGIGGPGQAVGDLYYGSWLAFFAALGVASGLHVEVTKKRKQENVYASSDSSTFCSEDGRNTTSLTPYSFWDTATKGESKVLV